MYNVVTVIYNNNDYRERLQDTIFQTKFSIGGRGNFP
jgi:hypothetical protein